MYAEENYSDLKRKDILTQATTQRNLEDIMLKHPVTEETNNDISSPSAILSTYCYFLGADQGIAHNSLNFLTSLLDERGKKTNKPII